MGQFSSQPTGLPDVSMQHLNGNLLCAIDVETTGLRVRHHEIWQIAILPLGPDIRPLKQYVPFYQNLKVQCPENIDPDALEVSKTRFADMQLRALDPFDAADLLETWFERLKLPIKKKILPLAQNWVFDREFIREWLGIETFDYIFHHRARDAMVAALFMNDLADHKNIHVPYPIVSLKELGYRLHVKNEKPHDALQDCITTAEVYRKMLVAHV
jgi:DNA polymerase III epsilon subunit-like protein